MYEKAQTNHQHNQQTTVSSNVTTTDRFNTPAVTSFSNDSSRNVVINHSSNNHDSLDVPINQKHSFSSSIFFFNLYFRVLLI